MSYPERLGRELAAVGIHGRLRGRILAEAADHLASGGTEERFGDPRAIAERFAAELAPSVSRRGAWSAFAALAVAGGVYAVAFLSVSPRTAAPAPFAVAVVAPQVAFVAGCLAVLRALRRPADTAVIGRRALLGIGAGIAALGSVASLASPLYAVPVVLLLAAVPRTVAAARLRAPAAVVGDLRDDLGLRIEPWRAARWLALALFVVVAAAGAVQGDPFDGLLRAALESLACLAGFWAFGRPIGLRR
ncbi:MAG TPA: hypothetical protein VFL66_10835 [Gaiellaceae bacterium]|nr:hypothetical protein [Gaiellaceae bacterium]